MHVAAIYVRCKSGVLVAKPTRAWPPPGRKQPRSHSYGALRPPVQLEACLPCPSVGCTEAALSVAARSPRGFGAGGHLPHGPWRRGRCGRELWSI
eukprot:363475-Chlamydomonas_euryale.AAC.1